jgi:sugar (pentulose or hexulose) kinase
VFCGLHDSNAALLAARQLPQLRNRDATVLSTGTWFVAMRIPYSASERPELPENRDCLVNVDVNGVPVPSSRFMGGRELEILAGAAPASINAPLKVSDAQNQAVEAIERGEMILPAQIAGVGPYPHSDRRKPERPRAAAAPALAHLYAALVADVSLDLIGSHETLLVDGRFSQSTVFVGALAQLRPDTAVFVSDDENGVAHGALELTGRRNVSARALERVIPLPIDLTEYRKRWREAAEPYR